MTDVLSLRDSSQSESFGVSLFVGSTPRVIHEFVKDVVAANKKLRSQLALANREISRLRGNSDNATTEPDELRAAVQPAGSEDDGPVSDQSRRQPSTLDRESSSTRPVQPEPDSLVLEEARHTLMLQQVGQTLEAIHASLHGPSTEREPEARSYPLHSQQDNLNMMLEVRRRDVNDLRTVLDIIAERHQNQEEEFKHRIQVLNARIVELEQQVQEHDALRVRALEVENERNRLKKSLDDQNRDLQNSQRAKDELEKELNETRTVRDRLHRQAQNTESDSKELRNKLDSLQNELRSIKIDNQQLHDARKLLTEEFTQCKESLEEHVRMLRDANATISSLSARNVELEDQQKRKEQAAEEIESLQQERDSLRAKLEQLPCSEQAAEEMERLQQERDSLRAKLEQLQNDLKSTSGEEQRKTIMQLRIKNRELELKLEAMRKSKDILQTMVEDNKSKMVEIELRDQLADVKAMLKVCEDLARTRGETIENLKREQSRSVENSDAFRALRSQFDGYKSTLDEERKKKLEIESALDKELQNSETMKSKLEEITKELEDLRLITMRQRHNPPPAPRISGLVSDADTGSSAAAAAAAPSAFAQPLRQDVATDSGSPRARVATRQSAVQTPSNNRLPASPQPPAFRMGPPTTHRCQYCGAQHPDWDSRFVHEKDCPKRPFDD